MWKSVIWALHAQKKLFKIVYWHVFAVISFYFSHLCIQMWSFLFFIHVRMTHSRWHRLCGRRLLTSQNINWYVNDTYGTIQYNYGNDTYFITKNYNTKNHVLTGFANHLPKQIWDLQLESSHVTEGEFVSPHGKALPILADEVNSHCQSATELAHSKPPFMMVTSQWHFFNVWVLMGSYPLLHAPKPVCSCLRKNKNG